MRETEKRNPKTVHIDNMTTGEMIAVINEENRRAFEAVEEAKDAVAAAVDAVSSALGRGGRMFYVGAGTSGRLGVVDASECPPTFGVSEDTVVGVIAGGRDAMFAAGEKEEDSEEQGGADLTANGAKRGDAVVGISAAGSAPYVIGALKKAKELGCVTVALTSNEGAPISALADISIVTRTGAEVITGSTRMKAGTAQKLVLNTLSTCAMVKTGKVYENLMINLKPSNEKLRLRMIGITAQLSGVTEARAQELLEENGWEIRRAVSAARAAEENEEKRAPEDKPTVYLGVDGGGTKTDLALCGEDGRLICRVTRSGCNPTVCGMERTLEVLDEGMTALGIDGYTLAGAFLGIAGCPDEQRKNALTAAFSRRFPGVPVGADADILNVICLTEHRENCVAAICGTGSVAFAVSGGKTFRVGGWGPLFDNAGSGCDLGRDAVRAVLAEQDGFGEHTLLTGMLKEKLGECIFDGAARIASDDQQKIASFAPLVFEAERAGDRVAAEILERSFSRLAFLINTASRLYGCKPHVVLSGGVTAHEDAVRKYLCPHLDAGLILTIPRVDPVFGALAKAMELGRQKNE